MMTTECPSKNETRTRPHDEGVKVGVDTFTKKENIVDAITAVSGAPEPEAESAFQVVKAILRVYTFVRNTYFNKLDDLHERDTCFAL